MLFVIVISLLCVSFSFLFTSDSVICVQSGDVEATNEESNHLLSSTLIAAE